MTVANRRRFDPSGRRLLIPGSGLRRFVCFYLSHLRAPTVFCSFLAFLAIFQGCTHLYRSKFTRLKHVQTGTCGNESVPSNKSKPPVPSVFFFLFIGNVLGHRANRCDLVTRMSFDFNERQKMLHFIGADLESDNKSCTRVRV